MINAEVENFQKEGKGVVEEDLTGFSATMSSSSSDFSSFVCLSVSEAFSFLVQ